MNLHRVLRLIVRQQFYFLGVVLLRAREFVFVHEIRRVFRRFRYTDVRVERFAVVAAALDVWHCAIDIIANVQLSPRFHVKTVGGESPGRAEQLVPQTPVGVDARRRRAMLQVRKRPAVAELRQRDVPRRVVVPVVDFDQNVRVLIHVALVRRFARVADERVARVDERAIRTRPRVEGLIVRIRLVVHRIARYRPANFVLNEIEFRRVPLRRRPHEIVTGGDRTGANSGGSRNGAGRRQNAATFRNKIR